MYLPNKYTLTYCKIIERAKTRCLDGYVEKHHIIPKSLGGSNTKSNIVALTAKEHFICHMLLIKMVDHQYKQKMIHAWWAMSTLKKSCQERYKLSATMYSIVRKKYSERMSVYNPMKDPHSQTKRVETWKANRAARDYIPPRTLKDKFVTPNGIFKSKKGIQRILGIPEWTVNTIYNNLDSLPVSNGRSSKRISHIAIDNAKTWRENGFDLITIP